MSLDLFTPAIWADQILQNLQTALVYRNLANTDYEGDIARGGSSVKIHNVGRVAVRPYTKDTDISVDTVDSAEQTLIVDQQYYFAFEVDDIDKAQNVPSVFAEETREAAYALAKTTDSWLAAKGVAGAGITGTTNPELGTTAAPIAVTHPYELYDVLTEIDTALDESDLPDDGNRFVVVPHWFEGMLSRDDRFVSFGTASNLETLATGEIGKVSSLRVLKSNQVPKDASGNYQLLAGHPMAWSFADQIVEVEGYRHPTRFADVLRGLHVYGAEVVRAANLAVATVTRPAYTAVTDQAA